MDMIRLSVPGTLLFRAVVLRVAASSCRLMRSRTVGNLAHVGKQEPSREAQEFDDKVVSAVGEAFNNVAIHAYRGGAAGTVEFEFEIRQEAITIRIADSGASFDPAEVLAPDLATLPESHMGLYIVRSCMDEVSYECGHPPSAPNVLTLTKRYVAAGC
jgi:serine/threonine-protein kinase RsbW